jgi:hypothetical protein
MNTAASVGDIYDYKFADAVTEDSRKSAAQIIPYLVDQYRPKSIVDVGCCQGVWLAEAKAYGVKFVLGIDGPHIRREALCIDESEFLASDFECDFPKTHIIFDMALCLEVAEHLTPGCGDRLVEWLCSHAKVIVWSAAIPGQAGVNHINEQWPSVWLPKFGKWGFYPSLKIRDHFWYAPSVSMCIRQNIMIYACYRSPDDGRPIDIVHPQVYLFKIFGWNYGGNVPKQP